MPKTVEVTIDRTISVTIEPPVSSPMTAANIVVQQRAADRMLHKAALCLARAQAYEALAAAEK